MFGINLFPFFLPPLLLFRWPGSSWGSDERTSCMMWSGTVIMEKNMNQKKYLFVLKWQSVADWQRVRVSEWKELIITYFRATYDGNFRSCVVGKRRKRKYVHPNSNYRQSNPFRREQEKSFIQYSKRQKDVQRAMRLPADSECAHTNTWALNMINVHVFYRYARNHFLETQTECIKCSIKIDLREKWQRRAKGSAFFLITLPCAHRLHWTPNAE